VAGRVLLPEALQDGFMAATNTVQGNTMPLEKRVSPAGSFTEPEYASVGLTEKKARETQDVVTAIIHFDSTIRLLNRVAIETILGFQLRGGELRFEPCMPPNWP
jgi:pyruvate/2-oxoglutarate dehydrogenase complex dihydrolipoamide dehydrogenase (E3) component